MATTPGGRRPKKLAGHGRTARSSSLSRRPDGDLDKLDQRVDEPVELEEPVEEEVEEPDDEPDERPAWGRRATVVLAVLAAVLAAVVVAEGIYLGSAPDAPDTVSADRPVVVSPLDAQAVVDEAARDVVQIVSGSYDTFDEDLERAVGLMTADFADKFRQTKEDVRERWTSQRIKVTAQVSAQGVVQADADQVKALVFLTQTTTKGNGGPTLVQFRIEATMVNTDDGWLVSDLRTF